MYGMPDFYQNDNVKKGTGMQWRHQVVSDLPTTNHHKPPGKNQNHHAPPQTTTKIWDIGV